MSQTKSGRGEPYANAKSGKETASNSSKEDEIMSSKVQPKTKAIRKLPAKRKTGAASSKKKPPSKLKDELMDSDLEGSSSDEKFLEEFESDGSDFSSSSDSDNLSQEFSDEDELMEYYEKKLREHAIVGNFSYNSDVSEDSEPHQELKKLVEETFTLNPPEKDSRLELRKKFKTPTKKAVIKVGKTDQTRLTNTSCNLQLTKGITGQKSSNVVKVDMKSVINGLKSGKQPVKNVKMPIPAQMTPLKRVNNPLVSKKPGSHRTRPQAVSRSRSTSLNSVQPKGGEDPGSYEKVADYLARIKQVQNSITEINRNINVDEKYAILKSARAAILEQRGSNKKSFHGSSAKSEDDSEAGETQLKDEVVDRILNATLGVS